MIPRLRSVFSFPDPVDEVSARLVAGGVVAQVALFALVREGWLLVPLVYGFAARAATGPTLSPLGQLVTRVVRPRVSATPRFVPGPPKRLHLGGAEFVVALGFGPIRDSSNRILAVQAWRSSSRTISKRSGDTLYNVDNM